MSEQELHVVVGAAGVTGRLVVRHLTGRQLRALGAVVPLARDGAALIYQFEQPFVVDGAATADAFGITPTPYADGVRAVLAAGGTVSR